MWYLFLDLVVLRASSSFIWQLQFIYFFNGQKLTRTITTMVHELTAENSGMCEKVLIDQKVFNASVTQHLT